MFNDPGTKIKISAKILFWVGVVASVILAIVFGWEEHYSGYSKIWTEFKPILFFSLLIGGPISSYLSSLLLYGYGCLVESNSTY